MYGLPVHEFDQLKGNRADVEKGAFPAISCRFAVVRSIGIVYVPLFNGAADPDNLFQVFDCLINTLDDHSHLEIIGRFVEAFLLHRLYLLSF